MQRIVLREGLLLRVRKQGEILKAALTESLGRFDEVGDIRGRGYLIGIEFVKDRISKEPFPVERGVSYSVGRQAFRGGLICYPCAGNVGNAAGDTVIIAPPYNSTDDELRELVEKFTTAVEGALSNLSR